MCARSTQSAGVSFAKGGCLTNHESSRMAVEAIWRPINDHRAVVDCALLVARRQPTPLLGHVDGAPDHVATGADGIVEDQRTTQSGCTMHSLVASLWDEMRDLPVAQQAATTAGRPRRDRRPLA